MDDYNKKLKDSLEKKGITDEYLFHKAEELIKAIETGAFKPKNKKQVLRRLNEDRKAFLESIDDKKTT